MSQLAPRRGLPSSSSDALAYSNPDIDVDAHVDADAEAEAGHRWGSRQSQASQPLPSPRSQTSFDDNPAGRLISVSSLSSLGSLPHPGQRLVCLQVFPFRLQRLTLLGPVLPSYKCVALRVSSRWTANYCCVSQKAYPQTKKTSPGQRTVATRSSLRNKHQRTPSTFCVLFHSPFHVGQGLFALNLFFFPRGVASASVTPPARPFVPTFTKSLPSWHNSVAI